MMVCAHGNVTEFCNAREMSICETWDGEITEYNGTCRVLVTDSDISEKEYYFLKSELLRKGIELISTRYKDDEGLLEFLVYANKRRRVRTGGRRRFDDPEVITRIVELRGMGLSLRAIREDDRVRYPNGNKLSISTIGNIIKKESRG